MDSDYKIRKNQKFFFDIEIMCNFAVNYLK